MAIPDQDNPTLAIPLSPEPLPPESILHPGEIGRLEITIDWGWDPDRKKLIDNRTGLDLLVDGEPNPAIPDAPDRH